MEILSFQKIVLMMIMTVMFGNLVKSDEHFVGGDKFSWRPNVNFTEWSSHEHFHQLDWLCFGYDRHLYNDVLQVNVTSYKKCIDTGFIKNLSRGAGRDVFHLKELKTYYFLSGGGYCWNGMKVAIHVTEGSVAPTPQHSSKSGTPAPSPKSGSVSKVCDIQANQILLVFILVLTWGISSNNNSY